MRIPLFSPLLAALLAMPLAAAVAAPRAHSSGSHSSGRPKHVEARETPKPQYDALTAVDKAAGTVTITPMNGVNSTPRTFRVTDRTEIEVEGRRGTIADLRTGMKITHGLGTDPSILSRLVLSRAPADPVEPAGR